MRPARDLQVASLRGVTKMCGPFGRTVRRPRGSAINGAIRASGNLQAPPASRTFDTGHYKKIPESRKVVLPIDRFRGKGPHQNGPTKRHANGGRL